MNAYAKPLPAIDDDNRPYWEGLKARELRLPHCTSCGTIRFQPFRHCPKCGSEETAWTALSGRGRIWSRCAFHQVYFEGFRDEVPYNVAVVELEEGPRLYSNIVGRDYDAIAIGQPVEAVFEDATPDVTLLKFRVVD